MYCTWCAMVRIRRGFVWWPLLIILGWCAGLQGKTEFCYINMCQNKTRMETNLTAMRRQHLLHLYVESNVQAAIRPQHLFKKFCLSSRICTPKCLLRFNSIFLSSHFQFNNFRIKYTENGDFISYFVHAWKVASETKVWTRLSVLRVWSKSYN